MQKTSRNSLFVSFEGQAYPARLRKEKHTKYGVHLAGWPEAEPTEWVQGKVGNQQVWEDHG